MRVWALGPRGDALLACCPTSTGAQRVTVAGSEVQRSHPYLMSLQVSVAGAQRGVLPAVHSVLSCLTTSYPMRSRNSNCLSSLILLSSVFRNGHSQRRLRG